MDAVRSGIADDETDTGAWPNNSSKRSPNLGKIMEVMDYHGVVGFLSAMLLLDLVEFRAHVLQFFGDRSYFFGLQNRASTMGEARYVLGATADQALADGHL